MAHRATLESIREMARTGPGRRFARWLQSRYKQVDVHGAPPWPRLHDRPGKANGEVVKVGVLEALYVDVVGLEGLKVKLRPQANQRMSAGSPGG